MRYNEIRDMDVSNAEGIACSIFFQGCSHHCKDCFNPDTWDFNCGKELTQDCIERFIQSCKKHYIKHISILGGEPFDQPIDELYILLKRIKEEVNKPIYIWTGYLFEDLVKNEKIDKFFNEKLIDVLIDGEFVLEKKNLNLKLRGSSNQRILRLNEEKNE